MVEKNQIDRDFMQVARIPEFMTILGNEVVLCSSTLHQKHMIFFTKSKFIILTDTRII